MSVERLSSVSSSASATVAREVRSFDYGNFDRGIEQQSSWQPLDAWFDAAELRPADVSFPQRIDLLLRPPSLDERIRMSLRPEISDPNLLRPGPFRAVLQDALQVLEQSHASDGGTVEKARTVVRHAVELDDLVQYYCSALFQA